MNIYEQLKQTVKEVRKEPALSTSKKRFNNLVYSRFLSYAKRNDLISMNAPFSDIELYNTVHDYISWGNLLLTGKDEYFCPQYKLLFSYVGSEILVSDANIEEIIAYKKSVISREEEKLAAKRAELNEILATL